MRDFTEFASILFVIALVIAGVQWLLLRFTHWGVALAATAFISFVVGAFYVQLKHATPNGGSSGPDFAAFITPTLVAFTVFFISLLLLGYFTQNKLPRVAYIFTFGSVALFGIVRYAYQEVTLATYYATYFSTCKVTIVNEADGGEAKVQEIRIRNTSNGHELPMIASTKASLSLMVRFADKISFGRESATSTHLVRKEFPFDYSLCKEEQEKGTGLLFWIPIPKILPMRFVLLPDEKVDLYIGGDFVNQYQLADPVPQE